MSRPLQATAPRNFGSSRRRDASVVTFLALIPVLVATGFMLMQVLGVWSY